MYTVAIQMDRPGRLNPQTDSTLILALEAQRRGYRLLAYHPSELYLLEGDVFCSASPVRFSRDADWCALGATQNLRLAEANVILMRQDPPFDLHYISACHLLERLHPAPLVVNNPYWVRNLPEKLFPLEFIEYMPPTLIASSSPPIREFHKAHGDIVLKPLHGYGGRGVFRVRESGENLESLLEMLWQTLAGPLIAQKRLPEVATEDRRVILIDGKVEGAFARLPAEGEVRANTRVGGVAAKAELTPRQQEICAKIGPVLRERGLLFVGLDLIGDYLTEINITSPTGISYVHELYGAAPEVAFWNAVERRLA